MEEKVQKTKKTERRGRREKRVVDGEPTTAREEAATESESSKVKRMGLTAAKETSLRSGASGPEAEDLDVAGAEGQEGSPLKAWGKSQPSHCCRCFLVVLFYLPLTCLYFIPARGGCTSEGLSNHSENSVVVAVAVNAASALKPLLRAVCLDNFIGVHVLHSDATSSFSLT